MISFDTNILFPALEPSHPIHQQARKYLTGLPGDGIAICELALMELYTLLRNPATCARPLSPAAAAGIIHRLRTNPTWQLIDYPGNLMEEVWELAAKPHFARRRIFDTRLALTLRYHGVTEFATGNVKDFEGFGFARVWNPLEA